MKRAIVLAMMLVIGMAGLNTEASRDKKEDVTVYICVSNAAKRYHRQEKCAHEIRAVTLREAERRGLTPCKLCY